MKNTYQLSDFVSFVKQTNDNYRIVYSIGQEGNIYRWLKTLGFGRTMVDGKLVTFRRTADGIQPAAFWQMNDVFQEMLEQVSSGDLPDGISRIDLLDWYLRRSPLKQNNLYRYYLESELNKAEVHAYKLLTDSLYRHRFEIDQVKDMLSLNGFKQTDDVGGTIGKGMVLYYRQLQGNQFLLFSHHNAGHKNPFVDGFDCWLASFRNEKQIGLRPTGSLKDIRLSFKYERDFALVAPYLTT